MFLIKSEIIARVVNFIDRHKKQVGEGFRKQELTLIYKKCALNNRLICKSLFYSFTRNSAINT